MDNLPILIAGFDNMSLLVCPPSPLIRPLDAPSDCDCDSDFSLEKTKHLKKQSPKSHRRHYSRKHRREQLSF